MPNMHDFSAMTTKEFEGSHQISEGSSLRVTPHCDGTIFITDDTSNIPEEQYLNIAISDIDALLESLLGIREIFRIRQARKAQSFENTIGL